VGAQETAHPPLAASGPYLPSLSLAPPARHHLRQEPYAGNPPVRICAGVRRKPYPYRDTPTPDAKQRGFLIRAARLSDGGHRRSEAAPEGTACR
jgi:hypothetical protein